MNNIEDTYNQALELIQQGLSKDEVLVKFAQNKDELADLLSLSEALLATPKNIVPTPLMRRKYALAPSKGFWLTWIHLSKFAGVSMSVMLLLSAAAVTGYAAYKSGPGQTFFPIKKLAEKGELILALGSDKKASLQVAIAEQRLNDAQKIFSNPQSPAAQKNAALAELSDQTSSAVLEVKTAANSDPKSNQNHPLLNSLENLASRQKTLLAKIEPDSQTQTAAEQALLNLKQNTSQISQIKQSMAIADTSQSLAKLSQDPNSIIVLGAISQVSATQITVEKTIFLINPQTAISDSEGNSISAEDLSLNSKVNVAGQKLPNSLVPVAEQILITQSSTTPPVQPEIKGELTTASSASSTVIASPNSTSTAPVVKKMGSSTSTTPIDPNTATGLFIFEDPSPHFIQ